MWNEYVPFHPMILSWGDTVLENSRPDTRANFVRHKVIISDTTLKKNQLVDSE